jgi:ankyrin repeat protein
MGCVYSMDEELIDAAQKNNLPEVRRLLRAGADVNGKGSILGETPLHEASLEGHVQVVQVLMEHGADIEAQDCDGFTPLHCAVFFGHLAVFNELLSPGDEIQANNDSNGATTCILGNKRKSRGGANIESKNNQDKTPLHLAVFDDNLVIVKALLSGGANILAADYQGRLPVHEAVGRGHSAVSKYLLREFYATLRRLPLHTLLEDLTWIGDPKSRDAPPLRAALELNVLGTDDVVEILEYLVAQNPALLSSCDQDGALPLHLACRHGFSFHIVQSLVNRYKASVKSVTSGGDLPLFLACEIPEPSLDTIFLLMKMYPDLVYR